jgi:hypothetical protein
VSYASDEFPDGVMEVLMSQVFDKFPDGVMEVFNEPDF